MAIYLFRTIAHGRNEENGAKSRSVSRYFWTGCGAISSCPSGRASSSTSREQNDQLPRLHRLRRGIGSSGNPTRIVELSRRRGDGSNDGTALALSAPKKIKSKPHEHQLVGAGMKSRRQRPRQTSFGKGLFDKRQFGEKWMSSPLVRTRQVVSSRAASLQIASSH